LAEKADHNLDWSRAIANNSGDQVRLYRARDLAVMRGDIKELADIISAALITPNLPLMLTERNAPQVGCAQRASTSNLDSLPVRSSMMG
jgi:hypothetical protein